MGNPLGRVVSVLGAGKEGKIEEDNMNLKTNYSIAAAAVHGGTMNTLAMEQYGAEYPNLSFVHTHPGVVRTSLLTKGHSKPMATIIRYGILPVMLVFMLKEDQAGALTLFKPTSARFPPQSFDEDANAGVPLPAAAEVATGSDGKQGSGMYGVDWNAETTGDQALFIDFRSRGVPDKIMEHTKDVFDKIGQ